MVSTIPPPTVIYGCMALGGGGGTDDPLTDADIGQADAAIRSAMAVGITWFDHADIYGGGRAESAFGEVLARSPQLREQIVLQSKCGIRLATATQPGMYDLRADIDRRPG